MKTSSSLSNTIQHFEEYVHHFVGDSSILDRET